MIKKYLLPILFLTIASISFTFSLNAQRSQSSTKAGEQRKAEKGLHDNRYFIFFMNTTVTNYGNEKQKALFKEIIQRDIMSQFFYMKFLFFDSYSQIRKAQEQLIILYREMLASEIVTSKNNLDRFAPQVISSKDFLARHYLNLGYRETANTKTEMIMADNYKTTLYSMRLYKYVKAIKRIKEAKKYALFAAVRTKQTSQEKLKQKPIDFEEVMKKLPEISSKEEIESLRLLSSDSFYKTSSESAFDKVWKNPDLQGVEEFNRLMKNAE